MKLWTKRGGQCWRATSQPRHPLPLPRLGGLQLLSAASPSTGWQSGQRPVTQGECGLAQRLALCDGGTPSPAPGVTRAAIMVMATRAMRVIMEKHEHGDLTCTRHWHMICILIWRNVGNIYQKLRSENIDSAINCSCKDRYGEIITQILKMCLKGCSS